jgi:hypothetical protein
MPGTFREHGPLASAIRRWLPSAELDPDELVAGRWGPALERALRARPAEPPPPNGLPEAVALVKAALAAPR